MKWVIFISLVCLVSFAELKNLPRRYRHVEDHPWTIKLASQVSINQFGAITLALFAQSVPNATLEEVKKLSSDIIALHQTCVANEHSDPECTKPLSIVFLDILCHDEEFSKKYGINDCCAKTDPERNKCALSHKISSIGSVDPFVHPSAEKTCEAYHNDQNAVVARYIYEVARRYPKGLTIILLDASENYRKILEGCCAAADKDACIHEKATEAKRKFREIIEDYDNTCFYLQNNVDDLRAIKFIETHQKFINANQETITHITDNVMHIYEELCKGDTLEALLDRVSLSEYVCDHKNDISSNLDHCCGKSLIERPSCLSTMENDARSGEIDQETDVCKVYTEHGNGHKERFLFILTRYHPEFSKLLNIEIFKQYKVLLEKCCKLEDQVDCMKTEEDQIKLYIAKISIVVETNCDNYKDMGDYFFQNAFLIKYSKIIPQAPTSKLIEISKRVAKVAEKCCHLDSDHQVSCALENTDKVLGSLCRYHKEHFINKQLCHCCDSSFISRWECISNLGPDPSYVPPPFHPKALEDPEKLCSPNEETVQESKQGLLSDLIKSKPNISDETLAAAIEAFRNLQADCCAAENKKECFDTKGQKLVEDIQNDHIIQ